MALTSEERRTLALQEARSHRPAGDIELDTLQFDHPAFDEPARVVFDTAPLQARLETDEVVTFQPVAFKYAGPATGEGRWPEIEMEISSVSDILEPYLDAALTIDAPILVTLRSFLLSSAMEGPGRVLPGLELDQSKTSDQTVSGKAGFYGLDRAFGLTYDPSVYTGLSQ